ncbi:MAG TPA: PLP-dependent aminotransferase family protein [Candidatus Lachnoclostridium stercorigallinarum]|uniref:PLP-dependent aminotransferase family protein n=1 Tax=Candidatus Lachnoclostridium stercorigallinarum TaxID=2838634 RepID=A0A9D2GGW5_9FIRM|nr:PLP-dependent aminotransferase family protein [Candidatus Lachnoclostridium stercorigallinarum]
MDLMIPLRTETEVPLYQQIYEYIKQEIRKGGLQAAVRLPSTRQLAEHLKVSRSTTQMAYDQLLAEGYIESVPCRGYFVCETENILEIPGGDGGEGSRKQWEDVRLAALRSESGEKGEKTPESAGTYAVDFSPRGIDLNSFPYGVWKRISRNILADGNREMFLAGDRQGEPDLREAIRNYLHAARGVSCGADQVVIGAGNEYLLMLLMSILGRGRAVAMENPTYKQAYRVLAGQGVSVAPVEMDGRGMRPDSLEASGADIAYVMPSHQFPTGIVMPVRRRQELLQWAARRPGRFLIEDDYDSEFRYRGKPVPALQGMGGEDQVIYLGTFSQSVAPAIRISYMVLPRPLLTAYRERAGFYASTVSRIDQNILYEFLTGGHFERHLNRMRAVYRAKHDGLLAALKPLDGAVEISGENAGIHLLLTHKTMGEGELCRLAAEQGVRVYGFSSYRIAGAEEEKKSRTVLLGYASLTEEEIRDGGERLIRAWGGTKKMFDRPGN